MFLAFRSSVMEEQLRTIYFVDYSYPVSGLSKGEVRIYDSCFHGHKLSASIEEQLVCIYKTSVQDFLSLMTHDQT